MSQIFSTKTPKQQITAWLQRTRVNSRSMEGPPSPAGHDRTTGSACVLLKSYKALFTNYPSTCQDSAQFSKDTSVQEKSCEQIWELLPWVRERVWAETCGQWMGTGPCPLWQPSGCGRGRHPLTEGSLSITALFPQIHLLLGWLSKTSTGKGRSANMTFHIPPAKCLPLSLSSVRQEA